MYDLIIDVHGCAAELKALLMELADRKIDGVWRNLNRKAFFLGDFVDRGPEHVMTVNVASKNLENGKSMAVTGNHEFNAVARTVQGLHDRSECVRPYNDKNLKQHIELLDQVGEGSDEHRSMINWSKTSLPHIGLPNSRVVHSSWYPDRNLAEKIFTDLENRGLADAWITVSRKDSGVYSTVETLLKDFEIRLPKPKYFLDTDGNPRHQIYNRLWQDEEPSFYDLPALPVSEIETIPQIPIEADLFPRNDTQKLFSTCHYWMSSEPRSSISEIDCLDYSSNAGHLGRHSGY